MKPEPAFARGAYAASGRATQRVRALAASVSISKAVRREMREGWGEYQDRLHERFPQVLAGRILGAGRSGIRQ
jgi:hypothetical protein